MPGGCCEESPQAGEAGSGQSQPVPQLPHVEEPVAPLGKCIGDKLH